MVIIAIGSINVATRIDHSEGYTTFVVVEILIASAKRPPDALLDQVPFRRDVIWFSLHWTLDASVT